MIDVISRLPLHPFPMAPNRRRSARVDAEEEARPTKKAKFEDTVAPTKTPAKTPRRKAPTTSKKSAQSMSLRSSPAKACHFGGA